MTFAVVLLGAALGVAAGRFLFGRWFNHVTIYSAAWGVSLGLVTLDLIHFYAITTEAWVWIGVAWAEILLGAVATLAFARRLPAAAAPRTPHPGDDRDLVLVIVAVSVLGSAAIVGWLLFSVRELGGWIPALTSGVARRYQARIAGTAPADVPYLGALLLAGCAFGGARAARRGRVDLIGLLPLLLLVAHGIAIAARAMIGIGGVAYLSALLLPRAHGAVTPDAPATGSGKRLLVLLLAAGLALGGFTLISATRGLTTQLPGVDPRLAALSRTVPFLPSIYGHLSASPVAFSEYLKTDHPAPFPSAYTFAPAWRIFARVTGAPTHVPYYEESYYTPVESNVATWLKNVHADFGPAGIVLFPFVLSALMTWLAVRLRREDRLSTHVLAANLLPILAFSFLVNLMMHGYWVIGTAFSWLVALVLERRARRRAATAAA